MAVCFVDLSLGAVFAVFASPAAICLHIVELWRGTARRPAGGDPQRRVLRGPRRNIGIGPRPRCPADDVKRRDFDQQVFARPERLLELRRLFAQRRAGLGHLGDHLVVLTIELIDDLPHGNAHLRRGIGVTAALAQIGNLRLIAGDHRLHAALQLGNARFVVFERLGQRAVLLAVPSGN